MKKHHHNYRDPKLDILRGVGLLCIILAHVGPPSFIFQLRNFDVPLMIMVSGASFSLSRAQYGQYSRYLFSRFMRLVIPAWFFLTFFFGITLIIASFAGNRPYQFSNEEILSSFALLDGIGYVWIIRVFFLIALIAPLAKTFMSNNPTNSTWLSLVILYLVYEFSVYFFPWANVRWLDVLFKEFIFYIIPYGILMFIGMMQHQVQPKKRAIGAVILLFVFACMFQWFHLTTGGFVSSQQYKYPPTFYYLSYAVGMSLLFSWIVEMLYIESLFIGRILAWIGQRTMWTYLWHILILNLLGWIHFKFNFVIMFLVVSSIAVFIVVIQGVVLKLILSKMVNDERKKQMVIIFSG